MEGWPSGRRRTPGKRVGSNVSGVRIPLLPPRYAFRASCGKPHKRGRP